MRLVILLAALLLAGCACEPGEHGWVLDEEHIPGTHIIAPEPLATIERAEEAITCP